jgi:hypothetical protein
MMHEPQGPLPLPQVQFTTDECADITKVITGYIELLQKIPLIADLETREERNRRISILNGVADRLRQQLAVNPTEVQVPLNLEEVEEVMDALTGFTVCVQQTVAPGVQRDYVLALIERWRLRLVSSLFHCLEVDALNEV